MLNKMPVPQSAKDLLEKFIASPAYQPGGQVLRFTGIENVDI